MADIICSAKSGSDWMKTKLIVYNITVLYHAHNASFQHILPEKQLLHYIDPPILNSPPGSGGTGPTISFHAFKYLSNLNLTLTTNQESFLNIFTAKTLKLLGFDEGCEVVVFNHFITSLNICGEPWHTAQTNGGLIHDPSNLLLVLVKNKIVGSGVYAEAQVIAEAIAAF